MILEWLPSSREKEVTCWRRMNTTNSLWLSRRINSNPFYSVRIFRKLQITTSCSTIGALLCWLPTATISSSDDSMFLWFSIYSLKEISTYGIAEDGAHIYFYIKWWVRNRCSIKSWGFSTKWYPVNYLGLWVTKESRTLLHVRHHCHRNCKYLLTKGILCRGRCQERLQRLRLFSACSYGSVLHRKDDVRKVCVPGQAPWWKKPFPKFRPE